jgi:hypothetical protein
MNESRYEDPRIFAPDPAEERGVALDLPVDVERVDERLFALSDEQACFASGPRVECVRYWSAPSVFETRPGDAARFEQPISTLVGGAGFLCALDALGAVWCWGSLASVASGGTAERPQRIDLPVPARALAADARHACVVDTDDFVRCWGERALGRLGDRASPVAQTPTEVPLPSRARAIGIGMNHSCAHLDNGEVHCWGDNTFGQIEAYDGALRMETLAAGVRAASVVTRVRWSAASPSATMRVGPSRTCACSGDACQCHGEDFGFDPRLPCPIERRSEAAALGPLDALACGGRHACALARGRVYCWGRNDYWQSAPERGVQRTPERVMGYRIAQP